METFMRPQAAHRHHRCLVQLIYVRTITSTKQCAERKRVGPFPRQRKAKIPDLYQLPPVILDLDAEDSPFVRPYNEHDEAHQAAQWAEMPALDAARKRITEFQQEMVEADQQARQTVSEPFGPWKVDDRDIFSVALRGIPQAAAPSPQDEPVQNRSALLQKVFERNGILRRFAEEGESKSIQLMLHRQELSQRLSPLQPTGSSGANPLDPVNPDVTREFEAALSACNSFPEFRRLVSGVSRTVPGCALIVECAPEISRLSLTLQAGSEGSNAEDVLAFLNNLTTNMLSKYDDVGEVLSLTGLRLASSMLQPQAIQHYLGIVLQRGGFERPASIQESLDAIMTALTAGAGETTTTSRASYMTIRAELLSVITGRSMVSSILQPSFRTAIGHTDSFLEPYSSYITLLGELGAFRILWHEWRTLSKSRTTRGTLALKLDSSSREELFFMAIARAKRLMQRKPGLFMHKDFRLVTGDYAGDALLDIQHIRYSASQSQSHDDSGIVSSSRQTFDNVSSDIRNEIRISPAFLVVARAALASSSAERWVLAFQRLVSNPG